MAYSLRLLFIAILFGTYPMETKTLVETLETPIKTTKFSSEGYEQRWAVLALNTPPPPHPS